MILLKPGDRVAQRPDETVQYRCHAREGWDAITNATVVRRRPTSGTLMPHVEFVAPDVLIVHTRVGLAGTPGARYDIELFGPAGLVGRVQLVVGWLVPTQPRPDVVATIEMLPANHVWVANQPISLGTGKLVPTGGKP